MPQNIPAFPLIALNPDGSTYVHQQGMTLRDYFAAQALAANADNDLTFREVAREAYEYANAMMVERLK